MSELDRRAPSAPAKSGEHLAPDHRLRSRIDFQRCYKTGRRFNGIFHTLFFVANETPHPRLGITASRKVGNSVVRHRLKRRVRESFRRFEGRDLLPAMDLVVHLKPAAATAEPEVFRRELRQHMVRLVERSGRRP